MADVIQGRFIKTTPPAAHPALMAASDYGMACVRMAKAKFATPEYDEAFAECNRLWEEMARTLGVEVLRAPGVVGRMRVVADVDGFPGVVLLDAAKTLPPGDYELVARASGVPASQYVQAWQHEEDPGRVISAIQKAQALRDGGASASSVKAYSVPLTPGVAAAGGPLAQAVAGMQALDEGHDPLCMAVLRGKACTCGVGEVRRG